MGKVSNSSLDASQWEVNKHVLSVLTVDKLYVFVFIFDFAFSWYIFQNGRFSASPCISAPSPAHSVCMTQRRMESIWIPQPPPAVWGIRGKPNVICTLEVGQHTRTIISTFAKRTMGMLINTSAQDLGFMCLLKEGHRAGERHWMSNEHRG